MSLNRMSSFAYVVLGSCRNNDDVAGSDAFLVHVEVGTMYQDMCSRTYGLPVNDGIRAA